MAKVAKVKKVFYPINLDAGIDELNIKDDLVIRKITDEEVSALFNMKNRKFSEDGHLIGCSSSGNSSPLFPFDISEAVMTNMSNIFESSHVLITQDTVNVPRIFNGALKLFSPSRSGLCMGFGSVAHGSSMQFIYPNPYDKARKLVSLNSQGEIDEFIRIYKRVKGKNNDDLFLLMIELFLNAVSGERFRDEARFIDLMTILEILYLPERGAELQYRIAIRIAKVMNKYYNEDVKSNFDSFTGKKGLYAIRSEILHKGKSRSLTNTKKEALMEFSRKSLLIYLESPEEFNENNLNVTVLK
jgi:hypothetical protein